MLLPSQMVPCRTLASYTQTHASILQRLSHVSHGRLLCYTESRTHAPYAYARHHWTSRAPNPATLPHLPPTSTVYSREASGKGLFPKGKLDIKLAGPHFKKPETILKSRTKGKGSTTPRRTGSSPNRPTRRVAKSIFNSMPKGRYALQDSVVGSPDKSV